MSTFKCEDCSLDKDVSCKYIYRFVDEKKNGAQGRPRISPDHVDGDRFRCQGCHSLRGRVARQSDDGLPNPLSNMHGAECRAQFFQEASALFGQDLRVKMECFVQETRCESNTNTYQNNGTFLDEADLTDKYKSKPDQLKNILANADTHNLLSCQDKPSKPPRQPRWGPTN